MRGYWGFETGDWGLVRGYWYMGIDDVVSNVVSRSHMMLYVNDPRRHLNEEIVRQNQCYDQMYVGCGGLL